MLGFLTFVTVMSFTPGPNTIMAMATGQQKGFRRGLTFNFGILFGLLLLGLIVAAFAAFFQRSNSIVTLIKIIGTLYLLYLAYHVFRSQPGDNTAVGTHPFMTGMLLQATNVKCYLYFITGLSTFTIAGLAGSLPARLSLMVGLGILGTLTWTLAGQLIQRFYQNHFRLLNGVIALLLIFSAYDLW
ncbi:LysE family transporter [Loigolactobacillus binensis]|uniref:LysE family transporter n=1 Tax=Loigolactobacillus binensis TaxID=2559922 RepID=A0ABW3EEK1_9LACO|nr:LysE family transporter [Loigolactobacillus binensis]